MQHVQVRRTIQRAWQPMEQEPRLDQRCVERAAVVGAQCATAPGKRLQFAEHRLLVLEAGHQELPKSNGRTIDDRAADKKRLCTRAGEQPGRLEVEEEDASVDALCGWPRPCHEPHRVTSALDGVDDVAD